MTTSTALPMLTTTIDGRLRTRFNARHIVRGYEKTGRTLDPEGAEAVRLWLRAGDRRHFRG
ncbi:MAG TPA: hypothetical protein VK878_01435 [Candidatus Deferrimicrobiaceae bacterium]|nr:hypothetical protein [Candidatus Deferrimicrobiaceae bacterium]